MSKQSPPSYTNFHNDNFLDTRDNLIYKPCNRNNRIITHLN